MNYYSANEFYKDMFDEKVYKIALNGGMTCPNRDGTLGTKGCIFCSQKGSGDFLASAITPITIQIEQAAALVKNKIKTEKYIAYFQSFTNTYAPLEHLKTIFYEAIVNNKIVALSIATRPDCLSNDIIKLLAELNKIKPVFVELGLQTIHESTAKYIRRGYALPVFDDAVKRLKAININVIVHSILGLPNENAEMMVETTRYIGGSGADGIKLQLLHVLKGTDLADEYAKRAFEVLTLDEYINILKRCINALPPHIVVHRVTGDGPKELLIAPKWSGNKKMVLNAIRNS
ncbi:TIGR01212 family radical SAM protein [Clostridia bacterium]|nr:TIGR01212 family radical SAM protein [Clostridia bacterium]